MLDWFVIPIGGGRRVDITIAFYSLLLLIGALIVYRRTERKEQAEYAAALARKHAADSKDLTS